MNLRPNAAPSDSLATRVTRRAQRLLSAGVLLIGALSLAVIVPLLLQRSDHALQRSGGEMRLQLSARLDAVHEGLADLAGRRVLHHALHLHSPRDSLIEPILADHRRQGTALRTLWLTGPDGRPVAAQRGAPDPGGQDEAVRLLAERSLTAGHVQQQLMAQGGTWRLLLAFPVRPEGSTLGPEGTAARPLGALVAEVAVVELLQPVLDAVPTPLRAELRRADRTLATAGATVGPARALALPVLMHSGTDNGRTQAFTLHLQQPLADALGPALWVGAAYLLLSSLLLWAVHRRIGSLVRRALAPLESLRDAAHQVAEDGRVEIPELSVQALLDGGPEVQSLADSFAHMLERLFRAQALLEDTVAQRTAELAQAKARLDATLASLGDGVYSLSIDRAQLLFASPPVQRLLGLPDSAAPMLHDTLRGLLSPASLDALAQATTRALQEGHAEVRLELPAPPDAPEAPRWLEDRMTVVRDDQGRALRLDGSLRDVTAAVRAEQRSQAAAAGLRLRDQALASTGSGVLILALEPQRRTRAVYANPAFVQMAGAPLEALLAADGELLQSFTVGPQVGDAMRSCVTERRDVRVTSRVRRADGAIIWCEITISPMAEDAAAQAPGTRPWVHHVVMVVDDVTEQRRQKELLRQVVESVNEVIFQTDASGRWTYLNPAWARITGHAVAPTLGQPFDALMHPDDRASARTLFEALLRGDCEEVRHEGRFATRDGGERWLAAHVHLRRDDDGASAGCTGTLTDVTEQRATEADLRLRNRAIDASRNGIVITDVRAPGQPVVFVNEGFTRLTGYSAAEALGRSCSFLQGRDRDQPALQDIRRALAEGEPCRVLLRNYRRSGERFDNDLSIAPVHDERSGAITHYVGVISDVTQRLLAERLLRDQFARLDTIFALSPDGFVSFDGAGRVVSVNPAFETLLGVSRSAVVGLAGPEFEALLDERVEARNPPGMAAWRDARADGPGPVHTDVLLLRGLPQRVLLCSRRDCDAPNVSRLLHLRDITRETEVDRMKSEFLSTAAHELRTPMASIRGFSDLLMMRKFDEARTRDVLQTINRQSIWLTDMVNELLDLARIEARKGKDFQLEVIQVEEAVRAAIDSLLMPGDPRRVDCRIPAGLPPLRVDRAKLQHALTNVLSNAYKYSPGGGAIELEAQQRRSPDGALQVGIAVRDHGIGMRPEHARRAFERFFRADSSGAIPGTGLGLALVKEIVELHDGQVELDSELGRGTTVVLWLPAWLRTPSDADRQPG
ncbi:MAG: PAS domain S-box protein [Burkholderiaceae bacterium]|nr:PAS domain S-box protein [Burkholderiaceae bacterium]